MTQMLPECVLGWDWLSDHQLDTCAQLRESAESSGSPFRSRLRGRWCGLHTPATDMLPAADWGLL